MFFGSFYKEHQMSTKYTRPGERQTQRGTEKPKYEDRKQRDILETSELRIMITSTSTGDLGGQAIGPPLPVHIPGDS
jgi:hypothetical protein